MTVAARATAERKTFSQILPDECKESATAFLAAAVAYYAGLGVTVACVMTDNGSCYRAKAFAEAFLGHRSTFETMPRRGAFPDDRQVQGKTQIGSIGVRVRSRRKALRHQPSGWLIGVGVKPPGNW